MNFDDLQNVWRSPHNQPAADEIEREKLRFVTELKRRRRGNGVFLTVVFAVLTFFTVRVIVQMVSPDPAMDQIDMSREWGAVLILLLPWVALVAFARQHFAHLRSHPDFQRSISESVRALLDENRNARRRYQIISGLNGAMLVILPLVVHQLRAVGKAGDEILVPAFVIFPIILLLILVGMLYRYRRKLVPAKAQLEALLRAYEHEPT